MNINAQNNLQLNIYPKIDFNEMWQKGSINYFSFSPVFAQKNQDGNKSPVLIANKKQNHISENHFPVRVHKNLAFQSTMPIAKPDADYWNMPVWQPNSTLNFPIKEKRFHPLDSINNNK